VAHLRLSAGLDWVRGPAIETVIIGAGPAGLTAGYALANKGVLSTILERDGQVGGISRTGYYRGWRFDLGGHRFFSKSPVVRQTWQTVLGDDLLLRRRLSRIYCDGHFFDYPLRAANALVGLGPVEALLVVASYLRARLAPLRPEANFEQWVTNRFGRRLYETFFKAYTEKVWGIPCTEISADWAAQRIKNLCLIEAARNAVFGGHHSRHNQVIPSLLDQFHYPRLGPGMFWERIESRLSAAGSQTLRGVSVNEIHHDGRSVRSVRSVDRNGRTTELPADQCISSMPISELVRALRPLPPDEVLRAADALQYRDFLTVVLIVEREQVFPDNWIYIHSPEFGMARIQNFKNWSPEMVPDPSTTSLGLEYILSERDELWSQPDERVVELGIRECVGLGFVRSHEVMDATVARMRKAYPVYDHAAARNVAVIRAYLARFDNLQTVGRNGLHRYNNMDHSMLTGIYAAGNLTGEQRDVWTVNTDDEHHEEHRVAPVAASPGPKRPLEEVLENAFAPLDATALGVSAGIVCGGLLLLASIVLLARGEPNVGAHLSLLAHYLVGYGVNWPGIALGTAEAGLLGGLLGWGFAHLHNLFMGAYARLVRRAAAGAEHRPLERS
jgi:protoporphyrinogen oxidase